MYIKTFINNFKGIKEVGENKYTALCPAHDDTNPSLSIGFSKEKNHILLHCYAGCKAEDILSTVGLTLKDLYPENTNAKPEETAQTTYIYHKADGSVAYEKTRIDYADGSKKFFFKQPNGKKSVKDIERQLYNLPSVVKATKVYLVEGEKCADAVIKHGAVATTLDNGANSKWLPEYGEYLKDKTVIIIPDNDTPGMTYAKRIAQNIPDSKIVKLPNLAAKEDIYDWLQAGHTIDEIDNLPDESSYTSTEEITQKATQAQVLLKLVENNAVKLFRNETNDLYAAIPIDGHIETCSLNSKDFNIWLHKIYYNQTKRPIKNEAITQTLAVLSAKARFESQEAIPLSTRIAKEGAAFWYDLSDPMWKAIKITADDWEVVDNPPILFNRYRHQKPQIIPQSGGDISKILNYINIKDNQTLFLCWLVSCFIPEIPHAMTIFYGEKGAAKSTTCSLLKRIIDPSVLETLTLQKNPRSLAVNLQQHWFLPFDNVSYINEEISDTLCRAITGGGIQQRKLFTDADDHIFTFKRCIAVNGINNVATRSDLLDRALLIELERISEKDRKEFAKLYEEFEKDLPSILGGVFDTLSQAMKIFPTVKLDKLPRMADFARWGYSIGEAIGGKGQQFLDEYIVNQDNKNTEFLNSDIVASLLIAFMKDRTFWEGFASELLSQLLKIAPTYGINTNSKEFPSQPNVLTRRMNSMKSNLELAGISFEKHTLSRGALITIYNNKIIPQLSPYHHNCNDIQYGDNMVAASEDADAEEDTVIF